jgi:hypothetical protein
MSSMAIQVVFSREHGQTQEDERPTADEERSCTGLVNGPEEHGLVELGASHVVASYGSGRTAWRCTLHHPSISCRPPHGCWGAGAAAAATRFFEKNGSTLRPIRSGIRSV